MSGHTPGPWRVLVRLIEVDRPFTTTCIGSEESEPVAMMWPEDPRIKPGPNARLIAAAPDLLEALKIALAALDADVDNAPISPVVARSAQAWIKGKFGEAARAAIKKAEGA